ncbi:MAG: Dabb family protein [Akkermansiaceae bacterium]|nr:Dabb family protein [Akkermansiaceae bacterium]
MIRGELLVLRMDHHVYFWLKAENQHPADRARFEQGMAELFKIPQVAGGRWAVPAKVPERPVCDQSWDYALTMRFASIGDHDIYQDHPGHQHFIGKFKDWWAKVLVTDLE